jgi:3D (Asp-Asp-Asp) domain-containing protein
MNKWWKYVIDVWLRQEKEVNENKCGHKNVDVER